MINNFKSELKNKWNSFISNFKNRDVLIDLIKSMVILVVCFLLMDLVFSSEIPRKIDEKEEITETRNKVVVIDMSNMIEEDIVAWCTTNNIECYIKKEYSNTIEKGKFIKQSVNKDEVVYEGEHISIYYSLGKEPTIWERNALEKAYSYARNLNMSKKAIYNQLISSYGEGFTKEEAQYAIDNIVWDWKENALEKAKSYRDNLNMSKKAIYNQLISSYGEGFTKEEAQYAIDHLDD